MQIQQTNNQRALESYLEAKTALARILSFYQNAPELLLRPAREQDILDAIEQMRSSADLASPVDPPEVKIEPEHVTSLVETEVEARATASLHDATQTQTPAPVLAPARGAASAGGVSPGVEVLCYDVPEVLEILEGNLARSLKLDAIQRLERACCEERMRRFDLLSPREREQLYGYIVAQCLALQELASSSDERMLRPRVSRLFSTIKDHTEGIFIHGMAKNHAPRGRSWVEDMEKYRRELEGTFQLQRCEPTSQQPTSSADIHQPARESSDDSVRDLDLCAGLSALAKRYPDTLVVLPSAYHAAANASDFAQTERALELVERLVSDYLPLLDGGGDAQARSVFTTSEYSANESETTRASKRAMDLRTFEYEGEQVTFLRHLRIGNAPSSREGWRCYFHHDPERKKIVIGHCGEHLDLR